MDEAVYNTQRAPTPSPCKKSLFYDFTLKKCTKQLLKWCKDHGIRLQYWPFQTSSNITYIFAADCNTIC